MKLLSDFILLLFLYYWLPGKVYPDFVIINPLQLLLVGIIPQIIYYYFSLLILDAVIWFNVNYKIRKNIGPKIYESSRIVFVVIVFPLIMLIIGKILSWFPALTFFESVILSVLFTIIRTFFWRKLS